MMPAILACTAPPAVGAVVFRLPPDKISVARTVLTRSHGSASRSGGTPAGSTGPVFKKADPARITLSDVTFTGRETKPFCDQLLNWMSPGGGIAGQVAAGAAAVAFHASIANSVNRMPVLTFQWGVPDMGFCYQAVLTSATITYTRFDHLAIPVRAKVTINLQELPSLVGTLPTNPTSGGPPGRAGHTVCAGEDLPTVARVAYGSPHAWRRLADANGIDDPLRLRPGAVLYLPGRDELTENPTDELTENPT